MSKTPESNNREDTRPYRCALRLSEQGEVQCLYFLWYEVPDSGNDLVLYDNDGYLLFTRDPDNLAQLIPFGVDELAALGPPRDRTIVETSIPWTVRVLRGCQEGPPDSRAISALTFLLDFLGVVDENDELGFDAVLFKAFIYLFDNYDQYDPEEYRDSGGDPQELLKALYGTLGLILSRARIIG